ncbi:hypothetical protein F4808DRAFT_424311 [Astrocystis sublimbata]|nr:hypothetical protein F4808DRAFT_424311 [Astrocystis sublimbata]
MRTKDLIFCHFLMLSRPFHGSDLSSVCVHESETVQGLSTSARFGYFWGCVSGSSNGSQLLPAIGEQRGLG